MAAVVEFKGVSKAYGKLQVLEDIRLSVKKDDFMVIYGLPSSGKTVLLRLLMGLEEPDDGDIFLRGENVRHMPPKVEKCRVRTPGFCPLSPQEYFRQYRLSAQTHEKAGL